jgi:uncharacterized Fe-S cluster-containing radical SAM superfamily protein
MSSYEGDHVIAIDDMYIRVACLFAPRTAATGMGGCICKGERQADYKFRSGKGDGGCVVA